MYKKGKNTKQRPAFTNVIKAPTVGWGLDPRVIIPTHFRFTLYAPGPMPPALGPSFRAKPKANSRNLLNSLTSHSGSLHFSPQARLGGFLQPIHPFTHLLIYPSTQKPQMGGRKKKTNSSKLIGFNRTLYSLSHRDY